MLATCIKVTIGFLPLGLGTLLAQAGTQDPSLLVNTGSVGSAGFFFALWLREKKSHGETWRVVERVRGERDKARTRCANCPGNEVRRKQEQGF